jgi:hypothetical protein
VYAWRPEEKGKALRWFLKRLEDAAVRTTLLDAGALRPAPVRKRKAPVAA